MARNVLGGELGVCSNDPRTGFFRDGCCNTSGDDAGMHTVCVVADEDFLIHSLSVGNDLSTPRPEFEFPGLVPGDRWCLCLSRWVEALEADAAPRVILDATHASVIEFVDRDVLEAYAWEPGGEAKPGS